jgi:hypothetical protein
MCGPNVAVLEGGRICKREDIVGSNYVIGVINAGPQEGGSSLKSGLLSLGLWLLESACDHRLIYILYNDASPSGLHHTLNLPGCLILNLSLAKL